MKRFCLYVMVLLMSVSCVVDNGTGQRYNASNVALFAERLVDRHIECPVGIFFFAMQMDEYLSLSEEDLMVYDPNFLKHLYQIEENTYYFDHYYSTAYYMAVHEDAIGKIFTGGKSIMESGAEWTLGEYLTLTNIDGSTWSVTAGFGGSKSESLLTYSKKDNGWTIGMTVEGTYVEDNGVMSADFSTAGKELRIVSVDSEFSYPFDVDSARYFREGQFNVNIYRGQEACDYCYITYKFGASPDYKTSI